MANMVALWKRVATAALVQSRQNVKKTLRQKAIKEFSQSVSLAGLWEIYSAPTFSIRWMFILAWLLSCVSILYHCVLIILLRINQKAHYEFVQTSRNVIPFPKVTLCAPTGINATWARDHIVMPPREQKMFQGFDPNEKEEFIETIAALMGTNYEYISMKGLSPSSDPMYFSYHHVLTETYKTLPNVQRILVQEALPSCEKSISNCRLGGIDFDCCKNVVTQVDHYGPCYDIGVMTFLAFHSLPGP